MAQVSALVEDYIKPVQIVAPTFLGFGVDFYVGSGCNVCVRLSGPSALLDPGDVISFYYYDANGERQLLVDAIAGAVQMTELQSSVTIAVAGKFYATTAATPNEVGLEIIQNNAT